MDKKKVGLVLGVVIPAALLILKIVFGVEVVPV